MTRRILVTDGDQRAALALVRSYGRAGADVYVAGSSRRTLASASRYCRESAGVPSALEDPAGFQEAVRRLVGRWKIEVLVPVTDAALLALLGVRDSFPCLLPFPPLDRVRNVGDKAAVLAAAREAGIAVPDQRVVESAGQVDPAGLQALRYPVVIKPARSVADASGRREKHGVGYASDLPELLQRLGSLPPSAFPVLLQQRVVGPGVGIFLLLWQGRVVARFSHRRIREKPPSGGVSVYRESIPADPDLVARSVALLEAFRWEGVAMVEYKLDGSTGTPYLMEINGRFWGSLQLAVDAGVDFPVLLLQAALGENPPPVASGRTGVRSRWWWGDVDQLLARLFRSRRTLALPPGAPGRLRSLLDFLVVWRPGDRSEVFRWSDPGPFLRETAAWFRALGGS
ncbi:MAG: ATP-grasp domain-containing protein [Gemmatimonadales bacterium]